MINLSEPFHRSTWSSLAREPHYTHSKSINDLLALNKDKVPLQEVSPDAAKNPWWDAKTKKPCHGPWKQYKKHTPNTQTLETPTSDTDSNEQEDEDDGAAASWLGWLDSRRLTLRFITACMVGVFVWQFLIVNQKLRMAEQTRLCSDKLSPQLKCNFIPCYLCARPGFCCAVCLPATWGKATALKRIYEAFILVACRFW